MRVDEMEAGRELNALVAEKVMGWGIIHHNNGAVYATIPGSIEWYAIHWADGRDDDWSPSTDIAVAWLVLERVAESWLPCVMHDAIQWVVEFDSITGNHTAYADTAPLAICRAALMAVGVEEVSP